MDIKSPLLLTYHGRDGKVWKFGRGQSRKMQSLNIALISFEYPIYTGYGGISSYIHDLAIMLTTSGHSVTVFCAGSTKVEIRQPNELLRECVIDTLDKDAFAELIMPIFRYEHKKNPFDVVESAEIYGDSRKVKEEFPSLPLVVKLHTPSFLLHRLSHVPISLASRVRFSMGALRRGKLRWLKEDNRILKMREEREAKIYQQADLVTSPSRSLIQIAEAEWGTRKNDGKGIRWLPNPYYLPELFKGKTNHHIPPIGAFFGRLEKRKGFLVLVEALRLLEKQGHELPFHFIGNPHPYPGKTFTMKDWALKRLRKHHLYTFTGHLQRLEAAEALNNVDYVVLPSLWENFPYTCLEAMGQEKIVLASAKGGMADMIEDGVDGLLINNPEKAEILAERIRFTSSKAKGMTSIGKEARKKIITAFTPESLRASYIQIYKEAIDSAGIRRKA